MKSFSSTRYIVLVVFLCTSPLVAMDSVWIFTLPSYIQHRIYKYIVAHDMQQYERYAHQEIEKFKINCYGHLFKEMPDATSKLIMRYGVRYKAVYESLTSQYVAAIDIPKSLSQDSVQLYDYCQEKMSNIRLPESFTRTPCVQDEMPQAIPEGYRSYMFSGRYYWTKPYARIAVSCDGTKIALSDHHQIVVIEREGYEVKHAQKLVAYPMIVQENIYLEQIQELHFDITGQYLCFTTSTPVDGVHDHVRRSAHMAPAILSAYCALRGVWKGEATIS